MKHGRSGYLVRTIIVLVAVVLGFIVASAAIRYNRNSGLFDSHHHKPASKEQSPALKTEKTKG